MDVNVLLLIASRSRALQFKGLEDIKLGARCTYIAQVILLPFFRKKSKLAL